jgi:hypothetical protein
MICLRQTDLNHGGWDPLWSSGFGVSDSLIPVLVPVQAVPVPGDPKAAAESRVLSIGPAWHVIANSFPQSQERIAKPKAAASSIGSLFLLNRRLARVATVGNGNASSFVLTIKSALESHFKSKSIRHRVFARFQHAIHMNNSLIFFCCHLVQALTAIISISSFLFRPKT